MAYTDQDKLENYLQRALTDDEVAFLAILEPAIRKWINQRTGSAFDEVDATTRYYDGGGSSVDIDPCTSVTAVALLDNEGNTEYSYLALTDYVVEPLNETVKREIVRRNGCFPSGSRRVAVTAKFSEYDGEVPADIQLVANRLVAAVLRGSKNDSNSGGVKSESVEGHSISYSLSTDDFDKLADGDPFIKSILAQHTEIMLG